MPPAQCPECGRFLKTSLVTGLSEAPAPCPGCGTELRADMFAGAGSVDVAGPEMDEGSVRPPDLPPQTVRDDTSDVLVGWDTDAGPGELAAWRDDRRPFPIDATVVLGAGAAGLLVGLVVGRDRRLRGAMAGAVAGVVAAAAARRVWHLDA